MAPIWMMVRNRDDDDEDDQGDENDLAGMGKEWCYMNHDIKEQLQGPLPSTAIYTYIQLLVCCYRAVAHMTSPSETSSTFNSIVFE